MKLEPPATVASTSAAVVSLAPSSPIYVPSNVVKSTVVIDDLEPCSSSSNNSVSERGRHIESTIAQVIASAARTGPLPGAGSFSLSSPMTLGAPRTVQFEDLPENFLENISPGDTIATNVQILSSTAPRNVSPGPTLANLTPVSLIDASNPAQTSFGLTPLIPMAVAPSHMQQQPTYIMSHLKVEPHEAVDKAPGSQTLPSSLLSPLAPDVSQTIVVDSSGGGLINPVLVQQNGSFHYVKLELDNASQLSNGQNRQSTASVSTVDLANNLIATMLSDQSSDQTPIEVKPLVRISNATTHNAHTVSIVPASSPRGVKRNAPGPDPGGGDDEDIYIDTKELCRRVAYELKQHSIPQAIFAERVLCRSQGTLSDLLRNPKPWNKLKSGRETFRRMYNWLKQPLPQRLASLELWRESVSSGVATTPTVSAPPTAVVTPLSKPVHVINKLPPKMSVKMPMPVVVNDRTSPLPDHSPDGQGSRLQKRPRLVFTDIQKRTLQAIFKETQRPSREMQQTIAEHLGLDLSTVANFFMNARRRSRLAPIGDEPAPYQHVRSVTPPPRSPPSSVSRGRRRRAAADNLHIADTVAQVASKPETEVTDTRVVYIDRESGDIMDHSKDDQMGDLSSEGGSPTRMLTYERRSLPVMSLETVVRMEKEPPSS